MSSKIYKIEIKSAGKDHPDNYFEVYYSNDDRYPPQRFVCSVSASNGIVSVLNHSVGIGHSPYASIDIKGSVAGMKKNFNWKKSHTIVKTKDAWVNISLMFIRHPLEALAVLIKRNPDLVEQYKDKGEWFIAFSEKHVGHNKPLNLPRKDKVYAENLS